MVLFFGYITFILSIIIYIGAFVYSLREKYFKARNEFYNKKVGKILKFYDEYYEVFEKGGKY